MRSSRALAGTLPLLLGLAGCQEADDPEVEHRAPFTVEEVCAGAAGDAEVLGAWATTVGAVRSREGGPAPGFSPASEPWAGLYAGKLAAWCTLNRGGTYAVSAATSGAPLVDFMITRDPPGDYPDGPAIP